MLLRLTYGHRVISTADDEYVRLSEIALQGTIDSGAPGLMPVDLFPVCQLCLPLFLGFFFEFCADSKVFTGVVAWNGLQSTRRDGPQRCCDDEIWALRNGQRADGQSFLDANW